MISFCKLRWWRLAMPFNRSWSAGEMLLIVMDGISRVPIRNRNARITIDSRSVNAELRGAGRCEYLNRRRATADGCRASTSARDEESLATSRAGIDLNVVGDATKRGYPLARTHSMETGTVVASPGSGGAGARKASSPAGDRISAVHKSMPVPGTLFARSLANPEE